MAGSGVVELDGAGEAEVSIPLAAARRQIQVLVPLPGGDLKVVTLVTNMDGILVELTGLQHLVKFTPHNQAIFHGKDRRRPRRDKDDPTTLGFQSVLKDGILHVTGLDEKTKLAMGVLQPHGDLPFAEAAEFRREYLEDLARLEAGKNPRCPTGTCKGDLIRYYLAKVLDKWDELAADASVPESGEQVDVGPQL
jgi:hypothetical protein